MQGWQLLSFRTVDTHPLLISGGALCICELLGFNEARPHLRIAAIGLDDFVRLRVQSVGFEKNISLFRATSSSRACLVAQPSVWVVIMRGPPPTGPASPRSSVPQ